MKQTRTIVTAALLAAALTSGAVRAEVLLHEEFDGYNPGTIHDQAGLGMGLTGNWDYFRGDGTANIGPGLSGDNALVIDAEGGDNDVSIGHTVAGWGTGQLWMSYLYNETSYGGHAYVTGGNSFSGAFGHAWSDNFGINNESGPGNVPRTFNQTYRLVALIDWTAGTTTMWVDPDPSMVPVTDPLDAGFAPAAHKGEAQDATTTLRLGYYNTDCTVDDIIIGTEYADVAIEVPGDPPVAPDPVSPTDGVSGVVLDAPLQWTPNGSASYDVFLWKDGETEPVAATDTVTNPVYQPAGLDPLTTYNWRIDSFNDNGSTTGSTWTFTTNDGVEAVAPADAVTGVPLDMPLQWSSNAATSWDVYLWKDGETKPGTPTAMVTSPSHTPASLDPSTTYFWEIVSHYAAGDPTTSSTWSFTTGSGVPGALLLHEEFDGYSPGSIENQTGKGLGETGVWTRPNVNGTHEIGPGLSGSNGLVVTSTGRNDVRIDHTVDGWGNGQIWMSFLYSEAAYAGHFYVSGGGGFNGGAGHEWINGVFGLHNQTNPGVPYTMGETYRLVTLWDWDAGTTTLWVDPASHPVAYGLAPAAQKVEVPDATPALFITSWNTGTIDDIRIGTDFNSVVEEIAAGAIDLTVDSDGTDLVFTWSTVAGQVYDLVSSTTLDTAPDTWAPVGENVHMAANTVTIPRPADPKTFYAVKGYPKPPLLDEKFDREPAAIPADWLAVDHTSGASGTVWEVGDSSTGPSSGPLSPSSGLYCAGTNITANYTDEANCTLTTPVIAIPAGGATLSFQQYVDTDTTGDTGAIRLLDADQADAEIVGGDFPITNIQGVGGDWTPESFTLPAAALNKNIKIRFEFVSDDNAQFWSGFYIDDVKVEAN